MVTEGLLLSGLGGVAGYVVGQWVSSAYVARLDLGADLPLRFDASFDLNVFLFSLGAAVVTGVVIGLWPAWRASRADARAALHDGGKGHRTASIASACAALLVVGQISGALALLVVAGLFVRTLTSAQQIDLGFDAEQADHRAARSEADRLRRGPDERVLQGAAAARGRLARRRVGVGLPSRRR